MCKRTSLTVWTHALAAAWLATAQAAIGGEPDRQSNTGRSPAQVAAEIDRHLDARLAAEKVLPSPPCDDAEFLRRVYLDITGRIPDADKTRAFLDSTDPDRRAKLINALLASSEYGQHFGAIWLGLIARFGVNVEANTEPLGKWLTTAFNQGRGWDQLVRDLLTADGPQNDWPQVFYFVVNGANAGPQPNVIAGSVGQLFLGEQVQCAECHNHPFNKAWKQTDFWGMAAFFSRVKRAGAVLTESGPVPKDDLGAAIKIPQTSFKNGGRVVKAKFPGGAEPDLHAKGPFRPVFADWLAAPDNPYFAHTATNRLWAHFFGRGFVNPLTEFADDNPPSHPELLKFLAGEFARSGFDQKHLIRCLCNSQAYQRTSRPLPDQKQPAQLFGRMEIKVLSREMLLDSLAVALQSPALSTRRGPAYTVMKTKEANAPATDFNYGIPQALYLMSQLPLGTRSGGAPIVERLIRTEQGTDKVIVGLYLTALSRRPSADEGKEAADYVAGYKTPRDGYAALLWTLLNSSEFILNR